MENVSTKDKNMPNSRKNNVIKQRLKMLIVAILCGIMAFLELANLNLMPDEKRNEWLLKILQQSCGSIAVVILLISMRVKLYGKPQKWLSWLPCLIVAINNFQWWSFFAGKMELVRTGFIDIMLFSLQCLFVGLFEELIFRGAVFALIASLFPKDKKGLIKTFVVSCVVFALAHIFNGDLLQVGYTLLTGGLFAFVLIKTKNVLCCAFTHALYNWCGLLMDQLGNGAVFDVGTCVLMAVIAVCGVLFVLYSLYKYSDEERKELYKRLGIKEKPAESAVLVTEQEELGVVPMETEGAFQDPVNK